MTIWAKLWNIQVYTKTTHIEDAAYDGVVVEDNRVVGGGAVALGDAVARGSTVAGGAIVGGGEVVGVDVVVGDDDVGDGCFFVGGLVVCKNKRIFIISIIITIISSQR
jgi:ribosome-interacting GTPase 1